MSQDLFFIGTVLQIPRCLETSVKELRRGIKIKRPRAAGVEEVAQPKLLRRGAAQSVVEEEELDSATLDLLQTMQEMMKGHVFGRTIDTPDSEGKPVWEADDPINQIILLTLTNEEMAAVASYGDTKMNPVSELSERCNVYSGFCPPMAHRLKASASASASPTSAVLEQSVR